MDRVKHAASEFLSGNGKHKTTIDQDVRKATTEEQIRPHQHEQVTNVLDKEVHQDHHQTRVQPILDKETLPEKHMENVMPTQHKTIDHGNQDQTRATLDREAGRFRDTSMSHETTHSTETAPTMTGERIHHHVHEHIQPVIQKETIAPTVVHTTVPVHETHHAAPVHHESTTLPAKTLGEFQSSGSSFPLEGRGLKKVQEFAGCPQPQVRSGDASRRIHGENLGVEGTAADITSGHSHSHRSENMGGAGVGTGLAAGAGAAGIAGTAGHKTHRNKLGRSGSSSSSSSDDGKTGRHTRSKAGLGATGAGAGVGGSTAAGVGSHHGQHSQQTGSQQTGSQQTGMGSEHKPSLLDKLNPMTDSNGDGQAGFMK